MTGASSKLPDFVKLIDIKPPAGNESAVTLEVSKTVEKGIKQILFSLKIQIGSFEVTFVQICGDAPSQNKPKQLLRVSIDTLPKLRGKIPLVPELTQPFQKLAYHWVRDTNGTNGTGGLTKAELDAINQKLLAQDNPIMYKATTSNKSKEQGLVIKEDATKVSFPVVMTVGHHFVVVENNVAVLDHCFNNAKSGEQQSTANNTSQKPMDPDEANDPAETKQDAAPSKGTLAKSTKFLAISGVALQFKSVSFPATTPLRAR